VLQLVTGLELEQLSDAVTGQDRWHCFRFDNKFIIIIINYFDSKLVSIIQNKLLWCVNLITKLTDLFKIIEMKHLGTLFLISLLVHGSTRISRRKSFQSTTVL
jgi:hypothetical protein